MQKTMFAGVSALVMGFASVAHAQDGTGFELGARVGYGIPLGEASDGSDLSDGVAGQIPLWLDVGYRALPELFIGAYFQYGFGFMGDMFDDQCDVDGIDCSVADIRLGVQAHYHIMPGQSVDPWLGLGFGYEWLSFGVEGGGVEFSNTGKGFEFANLQAGADFQVAPQAAVGPFLSFSLGQYSSYSVDCSPAAACGGFSFGDGDIEDKALHEWLVLGVRGDFVL